MARSILIVEDNQADRSRLEKLLSDAGFLVSSAENGTQALDAVKRSKPDAIFMDVLMPGIDGYEACRQIKANTQGGSKQTIVMLTSKSSPFDRIRGLMAGCDAYLTKPVDAEHLYEVISRYTATPANGGDRPQEMAPSQYA